MNTPSHAVINLVLLGRKQPASIWYAITLGAFLPDILMVGFYFWHRFWLGIPEFEIWQHYYPRPQWQAIFDGAHSIPLAMIGLLGAYAIRSKFLVFMLFSMMLHALFDLPVHREDAHRHFFPFSDWRYISPVSYWDQNHFGHWFSIFEGIVTLVGLVIIWKWRTHRTAIILGAILGGIFVLYWIFVMVTWK